MMQQADFSGEQGKEEEEEEESSKITSQPQVVLVVVNVLREEAELMEIMQLVQEEFVTQSLP